ncbi:hypothetical protein HYC85_011855 [Camellia sinensis]|uniref:Uncharacterized protein n=1 Tax=Camellia sinensis TaxID=4442 RepID=A0A7J7HA87_CAMSI|nr:hypothetical protein HYC85_011855 [Camellia sinensis]
MELKGEIIQVKFCGSLLVSGRTMDSPEIMVAFCFIEPREKIRHDLCGHSTQHFHGGIPVRETGIGGQPLVENHLAKTRIPWSALCRAFSEESSSQLRGARASSHGAMAQVALDALASQAHHYVWSMHHCFGLTNESNVHIWR